MKLYSFSPTPNNRKVEAFIKHYDLDVEIYSMPFKTKEHKSPAYLKMNPLGKAPVLEDGEFTLWESNAILCYLATIFPETGALPTEPQARAECDRWLYWQAFHLINTVIAFRDKADDAADEVALHLGALNGQLQNKEFICGELTITDFAAAPYLLGRHGQAIDYTDFPEVESWLSRMRDLKGFIATVYKPPGAPSQRPA